ncbi:MAG: hypothetical protein ACI9KE_005073 [Polyangiales bacterium]|jgi:hypothetical protein
MTPSSERDAGADATLLDAALSRDSATLGDAAILSDVPITMEGALFRPRDVPARPALRSLLGEVGDLGEADEHGLRLPPGFRSRVLARSGQRVADTSFVWPSDPDGAATFLTADGGWIYSANSEPFFDGGASSLRFDSEGALIDAYSMLRGTSMNCSGGATPWHTWLSCEEVTRGQVYECDPWGEQPAALRSALGTFRHEAIAVDPVRGHLYLTEDASDGALYRFVPDGLTEYGFPEIRRGRLECAVVGPGGSVAWTEVPDPQFLRRVPTRYQVPESFAFNGGEGIYHHDGLVHFSTKGDNRVWTYDIGASSVSILYDGLAYAEPPILGVDAIVVSCCGDVLVAEDQGNMQVAAVLPDGRITPLLQVVGQDSSEVTGIAFDPSGTRLYFSSQRGEGLGEGGITYEVLGPFHEAV